MLRGLALRLLLLVMGIGLSAVALETTARLAPGLLLPGAIRTPLQQRSLERESEKRLRREFGVEMPYRALPSARLFRIGVPNVRYELHGLDYSAEVAYSSLGIRDRDPVALQGRPLALLLGDSFVEARQHPASGTPAARLEALLEAEGSAWWVVNAGIGGTGTTSQVHLFEHLAPRLQPRLAILLVFLGNDLVNNSLPFQSYQVLSRSTLGRELDPGAAWPEALSRTTRDHYRTAADGELVLVPDATPLDIALRTDELARFDGLLRLERDARRACLRELRAGRKRWAFARRLVPHLYTTLSYRLGKVPELRCRTALDEVPMELIFESRAIQRHYTGWIEETWQVTERLLGRLARSAARGDCRLVVALLPHSIDVDPSRRQAFLARFDLTDLEAVDESPRRRLQRLAAQHDIPSIDFTPAFARHPEPAELYLPLDPHLSAAGVELLTRELLAAFEASP